MSWHDVDFFDVERDTFLQDIRNVALPLFDDAHTNLERQRKVIEAEFEAAYAQTEDEPARTDAKGNAAYRETLVDEQGQVIGAATLAYICSALKSSLRSMTRYFRKTHPASEGGYHGKNWLAKMHEEFMHRFQIDLADSPVAFDRIEELFLARNAGIHWEEDAVREYTDKVRNPRFIGGSIGDFEVTRVSLLEAIEDAAKFVEWIHSRLKPLRKGITEVPKWEC